MVDYELGMGTVLKRDKAPYGGFSRRPVGAWFFNVFYKRYFIALCSFFFSLSNRSEKTKLQALRNTTRAFTRTKLQVLRNTII